MAFLQFLTGIASGGMARRADPWIGRAPARLKDQFAHALEVAPNLIMTEHAITIRPICFSGKTFKSLPKDLQDAVVKAGKEAGAYGRQVESSEDEQKLVALEKAGKLKRIPFKDRAQMKKLVDPVMAAYAKEIGAEAIHAKILAIK